MIGFTNMSVMDLLLEKPAKLLPSSLSSKIASIRLRLAFICKHKIPRSLILKGLSVHDRVDATLGKNRHYFYWYMH